MSISFTDLNDEDWQLETYSGEPYEASRNAYVGINLGLNYIIDFSK